MRSDGLVLSARGPELVLSSRSDELVLSSRDDGLVLSACVVLPEVPLVLPEDTSRGELDHVVVSLTNANDDSRFVPDLSSDAES